MLFFFYSPGTLFLLSSNPAFAVSPAGSDVSSPKQYLAQGWRWFQQVALDQAITSWVEAAHLYGRAGKPNKQSETVTYLSQAYQSIGQYRQALQNLESALALVKQLDNRTRMSSVLGSLGNVYIATGPAETAYGYLHQSLGMAREAEDSALAAGILNNLGNLFTSQKQYTEALRAYTESMQLAAETGNPSLAVRALINAAKASRQSGQYQEAKTLLDKALDQLRSFDNSHDKAYDLISMGLTYDELRGRLVDANDLLLLLASTIFSEAATMAETIGDRRAASYAWGYLGKFYEDEHRYPEASHPSDPRSMKRENIKALAIGLTESVQGFSPLPNVSAELQFIHGLYAGDLLLNQNFLVSRLEKELRDKRFTIVHIATHGRFEGDIAKTFLLTFDDKLTMERLDQFVGLFRFRDEPLELLALSACEMAAGDDRAALGLAGVAVKAGAGSTLATLWHINDPASSTLIAEFYRQVRDPSLSRAIVLQRVQLKLLHNPCYQHPGYWFPFLLINNWL
jgi:tetratricopeptide (TPR) repeat protein